MATEYIVKQGDTLSDIAQTYKDVIGSSLTNAARVTRLCALNRIPNKDLIYVGQTIYLDAEAPAEKKSTSYKPTINAFGLQSNTDRTVFATWKFSHDKDHLDHYPS